VTKEVWNVDVMVYDPGVRYYPDGSGQPPTWDEAPALRGETLANAIVFVVGKLVSDCIDGFLELVSEAKMMQDAKEWEEMADADNSVIQDAGRD
jgi:hypothetical protein